MLKQIFGKRPTTKADIVMAVGAAAMALFKVFDTINEYKAEQESGKEASSEDR